MDSKKVIKAAQTVLGQHRAKQDLTSLSGDLEPTDLIQAYAVQDSLHKLMAASGQVVGGWKIALTTPVMQALVGINNPCSGAIFADKIYDSGHKVRASDYVRVAVESEIAVRIGTDVSGNDGTFTRETIGEYVADAMAAIEIVDDRNWNYDTADVRDLVANNSFNVGCVLGKPCTDWRELDFARLQGRMRINDKIVGEGAGGDVLGHPFEALAWLANHLLGRGNTLRTGDVVLMGSVVATKWPEVGSTIMTELDGFESSELHII